MSDNPDTIEATIEELWREAYNAGSYNARRKPENQIDFWANPVRQRQAAAKLQRMQDEAVIAELENLKLELVKGKRLAIGQSLEQVQYVIAVEIDMRVMKLRSETLRTNKEQK